MNSSVFLYTYLQVKLPISFVVQAKLRCSFQMHSSTLFNSHTNATHYITSQEKSISNNRTNQNVSPPSPKTPIAVPPPLALVRLSPDRIRRLISEPSSRIPGAVVAQGAASRPRGQPRSRETDLAGFDSGPRPPHYGAPIGLCSPAWLGTERRTKDSSLW